MVSVVLTALQPVACMSSFCCSVSSSVSLTAEEWKARVDLAAIYRVCHNLGLSEGINNHLTATVPGMPGHFLVFAFGLLWSEVTASNLLLMDNKVPFPV